MRDINIAETILAKRREKGMAQDELAAYIGVSKASVSKWETGQCYPDITILPQLATFFGISIDELMDYRPQLSGEEIRRIYRELAADFARKPFVEMRTRCMNLAHQYYACYPLLFQIGSLLVNHSMNAGDPVLTQQVLTGAMELFVRVKQESGDAGLAKQAQNMEAFCLLSLGQPEKVIEMAEPVELQMSMEELLSKAYQMTGETRRADLVCQSACYQHLVALLGAMTTRLGLCAGQGHVVRETIRRADALIAAFELEQLHPGMVLPFYLSAAQILTAGGDYEQGLVFLERYAGLAAGEIYPLRLHGDVYFDQLDDWIGQTLMLGADLPRDDQTVRRSMAEAVTGQPVFAVFEEEPRFRHIVQKLRQSGATGNESYNAGVMEDHVRIFHDKEKSNE